MTLAPGGEEITLVSRLAWSQPPTEVRSDSTVEVPHLRGVPVAGHAFSSDRASRRRSWPNRAGICETGAPSDTVDWHTDLAEAPPHGDIVRHGTSIPGGIDERTAWFLRMLKSLEQIRGVTSPIATEAPCGILLTPGVPAHRLAAAVRQFPGAIDVLPARLAEFPGGIQLRMTPEAWLHADAYAGTVREVLEEKD